MNNGLVILERVQIVVVVMQMFLLTLMAKLVTVALPGKVRVELNMFCYVLLFS